jgi:transcriptional regulator with XRE-family HTH domain
MRSAVYDILPSKVRRSLSSFGSGLALARRKRRLSQAMMAERLGVSKATYSRVEKGDPRVSMGIYAMALFILGLTDAPFSIADPQQDHQGLLFDEENIPKRIRTKKEPTAR